ncbi:hypothetical protein B484DRAFT_243296 [Ochromonadaceae sp. CCMP2298]|nr:hypothetical protein B484DRAFT_243296 [Ochromonadaceae sp. CCMP2298]|mmetsp:Transcript_254/g.534  ORF Transcript_254/g.534 Transcript_254/m.534 type:complete len:176 (+) Transcript_254:122-649(+)|eukprot:CAMPEP_0173183158 /NCGR_PEP_ID=MMETSP1141-20130122/8239_1 /TAXON_ID=483371 /ORGANISM="non described non described, Strain CCMP2298" /LENGTH=175 /DNA_ID=CAMNT_0014106335 /DNA_START=80 /DNA_END=607 /DNA_ORIENTATION=-
MTAAQSVEAQVRLNVNLREIVSFFQEAGIELSSVEMMETFIDKHQTMDFLGLVEGFGKCMAFIDHDELVTHLLRSFLSLVDGFVIERKILSKKLRALKEDKKTDPDLLIRLENLLNDIDHKKAVAMTNANRLKAMNMIPSAMFHDVKFTPMPAYLEVKAKLRAEEAVHAPAHKKK